MQTLASYLTLKKTSKESRIQADALQPYRRFKLSTHHYNMYPYYSRCHIRIDEMENVSAKILEYNKKP